MSRNLIAIIGSVDPLRSDYNPPIANIQDLKKAGLELGEALAKARLSILVFSSNPSFLEAHIVKGYVESGLAEPGSIEMLYPMEKDSKIHGDFPEQKTHRSLFNPKVDPHPRWEASYYQSLPEVSGVLLLGGGRATFIMGLMALAHHKPVVSLATFGGSAKEIWAMTSNKSWINSEDHIEMGRATWSSELASKLIKSFARQTENLDKLARAQLSLDEKIRKTRGRLSTYSIGIGFLAVTFTLIGMLGNKELFGRYIWLVIFGICFFAIPICAGMAGSLFFSLRQFRKRKNELYVSSVLEALAHGLWAGLISAISFFVAQISPNRDIEKLSDAILNGTGGFDILLLFSLMIGFLAGLTNEAVFAKWETIDASQGDFITTRLNS